MVERVWKWRPCCDCQGFLCVCIVNSPPNPEVARRNLGKLVRGVGCSMTASRVEKLSNIWIATINVTSL